MSAPGKKIEALQWIEEPIDNSIRPELEDFELHKSRTFSNIVLAKAKENIFVPLGLLATTACLTLGLINMRRGNSKQQQIYMRGRVGFQAFTLAAMTLGVLFHQKNKQIKGS